jgi:hypothetical protein
LADLVAIGELTARYNVAADDADGSAFADTFSADGVLEMGGAVVCTGSSELVAFASKPRGTVHFTTDPIVVIEGDTATQHCSLLLLRRARDGSSVRIETTGRYHDELVRTAAGWRFRRRTVTLHVVSKGGSS